MVQRYRCATVMITQGMDSGQREGEMKPDSKGDWVMLSTYNSETARLNAKIDRLMKMIKDSKDGVDEV